ncbi:MAG: general secretion pathway protein GspK [Thermoguttaceae bacterium]|jgi:type II secretory pathway component PulK|nr:general secretion pathway protein GspK [Thermoguttaceae bacterium]
MKRRGMVLLVVVVVVAMLSLAGLSFVAMMQTEYKSIRVQGDELQLEQYLASGVDYLTVFLDSSNQRREEAGGTRDNPQRFRDVALGGDDSNAPFGGFTIQTRDPETPDGVRYGLENESAKLNLAVLPDWERRVPDAGRRALLALPGMTDTVAEAILDWVDPDSTPRPGGAEDEYYRAMGLPYGPRNAAPQCVEELLLVRGVTRELLLGQGDEPGLSWESPSLGRRAASSAETMPWAALVTVVSGERNRSYEGLPRVWLNDPDLVSLCRRLQERFDPAWASFIVAYRQHGPYVGIETATTEVVPFDPALPPRFTIESPLDLVGARVRIPSPDGKTGTVYQSPLSADPGSLRESLPKLLDHTSVEDAAVLYGRVNLNLAPREVLRAVPGMDDALVEQIVSARDSRRDTAARHPAWPLTEGLVDLARMRAVLPYLTSGGDVYRARIVARDARVRRTLCAEVVIDATRSPPRQAYWKDLRLVNSALPQPEEGPAARGAIR